MSIFSHFTSWDRNILSIPLHTTLYIYDVLFLNLFSSSENIYWLLNYSYHFTCVAIYILLQSIILLCTILLDTLICPQKNTDASKHIILLTLDVRCILFYIFSLAIHYHQTTTYCGFFFDHLIIIIQHS